MHERFTDSAKNVVRIARDEAGRLGNEYVRTEHLLLGLCKTTDSTAAKILQNLGVDIVALSAGIENETRFDSGYQPDTIPFTPNAEKALKMAVEESQLSGDGYIGTEHILLGLTQVDGLILSKRFASLNIDFERVNRIRHQLADLFRQEC